MSVLRITKTLYCNRGRNCQFVTTSLCVTRGSKVVHSEFAITVQGAQDCYENIHEFLENGGKMVGGLILDSDAQTIDYEKKVEL